MGKRVEELLHQGLRVLASSPSARKCVVVVMLASLCSVSGCGRSVSGPEADFSDQSEVDVFQDAGGGSDVRSGPDTTEPAGIHKDQADGHGDVGADGDVDSSPEIVHKDFDPCDDGQPCTVGDYWYSGKCRSGTTYDCDDGVECTFDICDGKGGCQNPVMPDHCFIAGACFADGDPHPSDPCRSCVSPASNYSWTADDGHDCDDGFFCTVGDHCSNGLCVGAPKDCDDGNICTTDGCEEGKGCQHTMNQRSCEDGNACTLGDLCKNGTCHAGMTKLNCSDGNPCTIDKCNPQSGCEHVASSVQPCSDGNPCTVGDVCSDGICVQGAAVDCDDGNPCTDNYCGPMGECVTIPNAAACDDKNACTVGDQCNSGSCTPGGLTLTCNDGNLCTSDSCDPKVGCLHVDNVLPCDDGSLCTENDYCHLGKCIGGNVVVSCADSNPCTDDFCEPTGECAHVPNLAGCDDGNICALGDYCAAGECQSGSDVPVCDDGSPCTVDYCKDGEGCIHDPVDAPCSDGNPCTVGDECVLGMCVPGTFALGCDDGNVCTDDWCDPAVGCVHTANANSCSDGDGCTVDDVCVMGSCVGKAAECYDGNDCTKDTCAVGGVCTFEPLGTPECLPHIEVVSPPRGSELLGPPDEVLVEGHAYSPGGPIVGLKVDGIPAAIDDDGDFSLYVYPVHGMNVVEVEAEDVLGMSGSRVRAYYFSHEYRAGDPQGKEAGTVADGLRLGLGQAVFDDDDPATLDDVAAVAAIYLDALDLSNHVTSFGGTMWFVEWGVDIGNIQYGSPDIELELAEDVVRVTVTIPNIEIDGTGHVGKFLGAWVSSFDLSVKASSVAVQLDLSVCFEAGSGAQVAVVPGGKKVSVVGFDMGSSVTLVDALLNWKESEFQQQAVGAVEGAMGDFPNALASALNGLGFDETAALPALLADSPPVSASLKGKLSSVSVKPGRMNLGLGFSAASKKGTAHDTPGAIARSGCLGDSPEVGELPDDGELALGIHDDVLNQALFAVWWGGALEGSLKNELLVDVKAALLAAIKDKLGLVLDEEDLQVGAHVDLLLPPIVTGCGDGWPVLMQLGDAKLALWVDLSAGQLTGSGTLTAYLSLQAPLSFVVVDAPQGQALSAVLDGGTSAWWDIDVDLQGVLAAAKPAVLVAVEDALASVVLVDVPSQALASIPWPTIPLDALHDSVPTGTAIGLDGTGVKRLSGITEVWGDVVQTKGK